MEPAEKVIQNTPDLSSNKSADFSSVGTAIVKNFDGINYHEAVCEVCGKNFQAVQIALSNGRKVGASRCNDCPIPEEPAKQKAVNTAESWQKRCSLLGLPHTVETRTLPEILQQYVRKLLHEIHREITTGIKPAKKGIIFIGGTGTQKTRITMAIAKMLALDMQLSVSLETHRTFFDGCMNSFKDNFNHSVWLTNLIWAQVLIFDDVGQMKFSPQSGADFFTLISERHAANRITILTTNFKGEDFLSRMPDRNDGVALMRRIAELCYVVETGGGIYQEKLPF